MKNKYEAVCFMETLGTFETFKDAFKAIYDKIKASVGLSWQALETTVWIQNTADGTAPTFFYEARDKMCHEGFLKDGIWVGR